jgi:hypothetical protein
MAPMACLPACPDGLSSDSYLSGQRMDPEPCVPRGIPRVFSCDSVQGRLEVNSGMGMCTDYD